MTESGGSDPRSVRRVDSRRITGPHLVLPGAGAIIDATGPTATVNAVMEAWRERVELLLDEFGWRADSAIESRMVPIPGTDRCDASVGFTAPIDVLYAATEVNEWAWDRASLAASGGEEPESLAEAIARLRREIEAEATPKLLVLQAAADAHGVAFVWDDDEVSVGLGAGAQVWPSDRLPEPEEVDWSARHDVPVIIVTGTNGKTTTVRLLASIAGAAGRSWGLSSTDGVVIDGTLLEGGDYAGPGGARLVLRQPEVELAILETARGGLLRRGLGVERATAVAVTNVAADHLGEFGVHDVDAVAAAKLTVARAATDLGSLILNADDARLRAWGETQRERVTWFSLDDAHPTVRAHVDAGGDACTLRDREIVLWRSGEASVVTTVGDVPVTFDGAARFNVANALVAVALAARAGFEDAAIRNGLAAFEPTPENSPGRCNWFDLDGVRVFADFAHNPHGFEAMVDMAERLERRRLGIVIGQAGDRDDFSITELARIAWTLEPDRIVVKEMAEHLRGREPGAVRALIEAELARVGAPADRIVHAPSERAAVHALLDWAEPGDLLLLPIHAERESVLADLAERSS